MSAPVSPCASVRKSTFGQWIGSRSKCV